LGSVIRRIRFNNRWTLKEMSTKTGIPLSTLSKVEHDRLTLTYDKLQQLSRRLDIRMSDLFAEDAAQPQKQVMARRSLGTLDSAFRVETDNYDYHYMCPDLRRKRMIPILARIRAKSREEFGALVRHNGEEFIYVVEGKIDVHTEYYDPVTLKQGESIYIDSTMGHAYLVADGCDEALVLAMCSSEQENLMDSLMSLHGEPVL
tara:strand:- start:133965 stop:134573 length:609 start_codon:yes stop_codon:yes gene_type:complete